VLLVLTTSGGSASPIQPVVHDDPAEWLDVTVLEDRALALEETDPEAAVVLFLSAAGRFEQLAEEGESQLSSLALWRGARSYWLAAEAIPAEKKEEKLRLFRLSDGLAARGLKADSKCAECMLWKFASMGRLRTTAGMVEGMRGVSEMAELLNRAIALQPTYADSEWNSTLGNLYYSRAIFNRVLPDWFWLEWILGVRGDKEQALSDIHRALAIHPGRLDYRIELGSQLLCLGVSKSRHRSRIEEGRRVLEKALETETSNREKARDLEAARIMLATPAKSCGYTGDDWVEIGESDMRQAGPGL
jgi:tetratricopeptide (TPR) repeat protein